MKNARAELKVCSPQEPVRFLSVRLSSQVQSLQSLWSSPKRFIFNGAELLETMTFNFYGIRDGDSIVAISVNNCHSLYGLNYWLSLTRDSDSFNDSLRWMLDAKTNGEAARLRDLQMVRVERKSRLFRRISSAVVNEETCSGITAPLVIDYPPASEPSTEPLPVPW
jgi:hypothetical protein